MLLGDDDLLVRVEAYRGRIVLLVTTVAVVVGQISFCLHKIGIGLAPRGGRKELGIDQRDGFRRLHMLSHGAEEQHRESDKEHCKPAEHITGAGAVPPVRERGEWVHDGGC